MAIIKRRYQLTAPPAADLKTLVSPTAFVAATFQGPIVDIGIDDALPGVVDTLDEYMAEGNYLFTPDALKPTTAIIPYASLAPIGFGVTTYVAFGSAALDPELANWPTPRQASLQSLQIDVTSNTLGANTEFMVMTAAGIGPFAATGIFINVPAGATGAFNQAGVIPINIGDRVALRVIAGGLLGAVAFTGSMESL